jgi:uncharacterized metal-binding protein
MQKLIFACSGAADVGEISGLAARKMTRDGIGKMSCLAGIGGRVGSIMESAMTAQSILVIDGCASCCAKKSFEHAGFNNFSHLQITDLGMNKGKADVSEGNINAVIKKASELLKAD